MAEIVNLRLARKRKQRADAERRAAGNRAAHGLTKSEKQGIKAGREAEARRLDGHRLAPADEG